MPLDRTRRVSVTAKATSGKLDIGPQDYFVLSRIEGASRVGDVLDASGLPRAQAEAILDRLLEAGAIELEGAAHPSSTTTGHAGRDAAARRRRRTLVEGLGSRASPPPERPRTRPEPEPEPQAPVDDRPPPFELPPVDPDDPRLDPDLAIPIGEQQRLLALLDRGEELTPFEMLGLHPTDDKGEIRNAFRTISRRLHPDAYHGRNLGSFKDHLAHLFAAAREAVKKLGDEELRRPMVEAYESERKQVREEKERREARMAAAKAAAQEIRDKHEKAEVDERRKARATQRARAQRGRVLANLAGRVGQHIKDAEKAENAGNHAAAANHYRLALRVDPNNADVKAKWDKVRTAARKERAKEAFSRALSYLELGQSDDALPLFVEAADADPTSEHLANAAELLRATDIERAREMAMGALNALSRELSDQKAKPKGPGRVAELRMMIARTFRDAGQFKTARAQAKAAVDLVPDLPQARALLNSIKKK